MCLVVPAARARPAAAASKKKKKKKKGGGEGGEGDAGAGEDGADKMDTLALSQHIASLSVARNAQEQQRSDVTVVPESSHAFWNTQPMRRPDERPDTGGPIEPVDKEIRQEPYKLPGGFVWSTCDVDDPTQMADIYRLLNENYVEDDDNMFRFDYSIEFLRWALKPPEYQMDWHVGVRAEKSGKMVGFITGAITRNQYPLNLHP